jgi:hypothetical protein
VQAGTTGQVLGIRLGFGVQDLGFEFWPYVLAFSFWGSGFRVWCRVIEVWGLGFGVWGLGFWVWGLGFGVWGLGFGVWVDDSGDKI